MASTKMSPALAVPSRTQQAVIGVFMQVILAVVYSWSVFRGPLTQLHGWSKAETIAPYRYTLLLVSFGAVIGGLWLDRKGARIVATVGGAMLALGCLLAAFIGDTVNGLILSYGIIGGLGGGFAYVTPIANLVRWFPDKRGMIVGLAVMGSGLSPLFWSPLIERLIGKDPAQLHDTLPRTFMIMAAIFVVAVVGAAQLFRVPPPGWKPDGWNHPVGIHAQREVSPWKMLGSWQFYALWLIYFLGAAVGLTALGQASPLIHEVAGTNTLVSAGVAIGIMGVFNGAGRLSWGSISDRFGRKFAVIGMAAVSAIACMAFLRTASGFLGVVAGLCLAAFAYGGFLALMPAFTADYFGSGNIGGNYGILFLAWGICGYLVPGYFEGLLDKAREAGNLAGGYKDVYLQLAIMAVVVGVIGALLRAPRRATS